MSDWTPDFGQLDRTPPTLAPKRPVRIALLGDFGGRAAAGRLDGGADLAARKPIPVEFDSIEDALARLEVKLTLPVGAKGGMVEVPVGEIDSFHPDTLYRELGLFSALATLRQQLNSSATFAKAAAKVQSWSGQKVKRASRVARGGRSRGATLAANAKRSDFARLVGLAEDKPAPDTPVDALLREVVAPFVVAAPDPKMDSLVAAVDRGLSDAMRAVLHHPEFKNLESLWRGLDFLLRRLETGPSLQVLLYDITAEEWAADLSASSDLGESALYKLMVENPAKDRNGGLALICGLYHLEPTPPQIELLGRMAKIAAQADASFVASMPADLFADPKRGVHPLVSSSWKALRALPEAARLAIATPGFMLRHPYGKRSDPISSFDFEEFSNAEGLHSLLYGHPALLVAALLAAPGGAKNPVVGELPFHYFVDGDGDQIALPCAERLFSVDAAAAMARAGLIAVLARKGQDDVRLAGLNALTGTPLTLPGQAPPAANRGIVKTSVAIGGTVVAKSASKAPVSDEDGGSGEDSGSSDDSSSDLDALLSGMGGDESSDSSSDETPADDSGSAGSEEMDPELAALLASLG